MAGVIRGFLYLERLEESLSGQLHPVLMQGYIDLALSKYIYTDGEEGRHEGYRSRRLDDDRRYTRSVAFDGHVMIFSNVTFIIGQNDYKGVLQSGNYQRIHSSFFHSPLVCLPGVALSSTPKARLPNDHHPIYTLVFAYNPSLKHPACRRPTDIIAERIGTTKERIQATKGRFCMRPI